MITFLTWGYLIVGIALYVYFTRKLFLFKDSDFSLPEIGAISVHHFILALLVTILIIIIYITFLRILKNEFKNIYDNLLEEFLEKSKNTFRKFGRCIIVFVSECGWFLLYFMLGIIICFKAFIFICSI